MSDNTSSRELSPSAGDALEGGPSAVEQAEATFVMAKGMVDDVDRRRRAEVRKAEAEINERFRPEINAANDAYAEARRLLVAAKDATPGHPWTGKRVFKIEREVNHWSRQVTQETRAEGVVETCRSDTVFPANITWRRPHVGEGFVRLLKKDGTPGKGFDQLREWRLVGDEP